MRHDDKNDGRRLRERLQERADAPEVSHVVFDFSGLERPNVTDLSLILTARLQCEPGDSVWVRSLPWQTARILEVLRLDHLFRRYPEAADELN